MDLYHEPYSLPYFLFILHSCLYFLSFIFSYSNMYKWFYFVIMLVSHSTIYSSIIYVL